MNSRRIGRWTGKLLGLLVLWLAPQTAAKADNPACQAGVPAAYCEAFVRYTKPGTPLDSRIADALGVTRAEQTRTIGLIIAIDQYPNLPNADVPAAAVDAKRLVDFLANDQKFDEVILLRNGAATKEVIDWFLTVYLPNRSLEFGKKARLLIAYSGHGAYETGTTRPAFVLAGATSLTDDPAHLYKMSTFAANVQDLSATYFHVLTLINACYGGNFFVGGAGGGDPNGWNEAGAYAITAGDTKTTVPALKQERGSLFFDLLISGVQSGVADEEYFRYFSSYGLNGQPLQQDGIARTGAVENYLSTAFDRINHDRLGKVRGFEKLSHPFIGLAQPARDTAGGFFFLSTHRAGSFDPSSSPVAAYVLAAAEAPSAADAAGFGVPAAALQPTDTATADLGPLPPGPMSSLPGHPEIKVFKPPEVYPIRGYDLSSADGVIDWRQLAQTRRPAFMYARAMGWAGPDRTFKDRWSHYGDLGVDRGAYLKFDFCATPAAQLKTLRGIVPPDADLLPIAVELVTPQASDARQFACFEQLGTEGAKAGILALTAAIQQTYGKTPLIAGNRYNLSVLSDARFDNLMVWLHAYGKQSGALRFGGKNPWTLWQYSGTLTVKGVPSNATTGEVFFGGLEAYARFKAGKGNVALEAAR